MSGASSAGLGERLRRSATRPRVFGHRGASLRAPENTLAAFTLAMDEGADGIELDTQLCGSGELVVMHDLTLARTTGDPRTVREVTLQELRRLDAGRGERVPLLDEVLELVLGRGGVVNIELKAHSDDRSRLAQRIAVLLARRRVADRSALAVSSFDPRALLVLRMERVVAPLLLLVENTRQGRLLARAVPPLLRPVGINPEYGLATPARVNRWRARGLLVTAWTVDGADRVRQLANAGVDGLITNDPAGTLAALETS